MLDIKFIRENPDLVKKDLERRKDTEKQGWVDEIIKLDADYRKKLGEVQELRHRRNKVTSQISSLKKEGKDASSQMTEAKEIPDKIKKLEEETEALKENIRSLQLRIPNIMHESVPYGEDDTKNVEVKKWGEPPKFDFEPKNHLDIAKGLGLIELDKAGEIAGAGFYYLKGNLAKLDMALQRFAVDYLSEKGYTVIEPPPMLRREAYEGVTDLSDFETVMYKIEDDDLYLIATSEHPMGALYMNEVIEKQKLPIKFCGISSCFRREIGTHGKYTKGLFRVHNFNKVEQFIFAMPDQSWELHEELQKNAEELYQKLGLHYRVVNICTGDLGNIAAKKFDIEVWMADGEFREVGSNSNCTDYQARRLNIKYREKEGSAPAGFIHTLNNTAIATSRAMVAILEQYQQKDGSVLIPEVLKPYMNGLEKL